MKGDGKAPALVFSFGSSKPKKPMTEEMTDDEESDDDDPFDDAFSAFKSALGSDDSKLAKKAMRLMMRACGHSEDSDEESPASEEY